MVIFSATKQSLSAEIANGESYLASLIARAPQLAGQPGQKRWTMYVAHLLYERLHPRGALH